MSRILATAASEFRIAFRNRWVSIATGMMVLFALVLAAAGAAPTGDVALDNMGVAAFVLAVILLLASLVINLAGPDFVQYAMAMSGY